MLPSYSAIYWWDSVPYYYYDNGYYTWDAHDDGYVAAAPPPVDDTGAAAQAPAVTQLLSQANEPLYAYPENGQSPEQQTEDRQACERWAASQAAANGAGSTRGNVPETDDYQRAMVACLTGRGYSVD
ncbi:MAG: hypothetical protein ACREU2_16035 [Steroidobacteraceae bacterium]